MVCTLSFVSDFVQGHDYRREFQVEEFCKYKVHVFFFWGGGGGGHIGHGNF